MNVNALLYAAITDGAGKRLKQEVETVFPRTHIESYRTIECLSKRLRRFSDNPFITVILAASRKELTDIYLINDLLNNIPIILILPDRGRDTVSKGYKLYPRFVSYIDSSFKDVAAVLGKMVERLNR